MLTVQVEKEIKIESLPLINTIIRNANRLENLNQLHDAIQELDKTTSGGLLIGRGGSHIWVSYRKDGGRILFITSNR